ncbi:hypothetical protein FPQ18DRAFT_313014 [Pyronema domesticum]|uniref:Uncharacterized protein n=1 Tax=Pyronema omphalodes (strain CBS 100304) TaxID=1076935 RepID=U4LKP9_PYROM|nr:hypothetical protein FPQ18DRAFT_313014 [Pyronema domesticum]CCX32679.1 Similar to conserved hypothetical protein [Ajellomyces dermatitidis SLH14081]; acc. no. XP_002628497 [Pyronema omphalodes CBS 100304]
MSPPPERDPPVNPPREPFFQTVRRFSDQHFSSLLHSLIGLPSSITPPATSGWIDDDGSNARGAARGTSHSSARPNTKPDGNSETPGSSSGSSNAAKREMISFEIPSPFEVLKTVEQAHTEIFRSLMSPPPSVHQQHHQQQTELDYYNFFESQFRKQGAGQESQGTSQESLQISQTSQTSQSQSQSQSQPSEMQSMQAMQSMQTTQTTQAIQEAPTQGQGKRIIETYSETRTMTDSTGVTKTRQVEVRRFSDGSEERKEGERTIMPMAGDSGRITEA